MKEKLWKDVVGYEGLYAISNKGEVRSLRRDMPVRGRNYPGDYHRVNLWKDSKHKTFLVHRLVLEAFIGSCPQGYETIHRDNDKQNNDIENIYWGTHADNMMNYGTNPSIGAKGGLNRQAKLTAKDVVQIRRRYFSGLGNETHVSLAKEFNVNRSAISKILRYERWTHIYSY